MSIEDEVSRLQNIREHIFGSIRAKGVSVPQDSRLADCPSLIDGISTESTGTIWDVDFKNYTAGSLQAPFIVPNTGMPLWYCKNFNNMILSSEGLELSGARSVVFQVVPLAGFSGKKIKFKQRTKGIQTHNSWCNVGMAWLGYSNTYTSSRGMGMLISSNALALGQLKNGHTADWGYTDADPETSMFIVPQQRLYPLEGTSIEAIAEYDFKDYSITYTINGVEAFHGIMTEAIFTQELQMCNRFNAGGGNDRVAVERITIECE